MGLAYIFFFSFYIFYSNFCSLRVAHWFDKQRNYAHLLYQLLNSCRTSRFLMEHLPTKKNPDSSRLLFLGRRFYTVRMRTLGYLCLKIYIRFLVSRILNRELTSVLFYGSHRCNSVGAEVILNFISLRNRQYIYIYIYIYISCKKTGDM